MGFTQLVKPFFAPLSASDRPHLGQIAWAPVPNLESHPHVLEAEREDDRSHEKALARWVKMDDRHFKHRPSKSLPILSFHLGETEELLCFKAKKRPVVIVGRMSSVLGNIDTTARPHHEEDRIVVAPIYGLRSEDDSNGFGPVMDVRVRHLLYKQYFPIAQWKEKRSIPGGCSICPGISRFDRLQFLFPSQPGVSLVPVKLSDDAFRVMHYMLWTYLHAPPAEE